MESKRGERDRTSRVVLHVGTPKTGTTYLQSVLWHNRALLRSRGVLVPGTGAESMFLAALEVLQRDWGGEPHPQAAGCWTALVDEALDWPGTVVISQELLVAATVDQARAIVASFAPAEVDVVVTARDLLRQVPAEWQENVKHGRTKSFAEFWAHLQERPPKHELTRSFREVQYLPDLLERWAAAVPVARIRLVTVPPTDSSSGLLWERFVTACGIDAAGCELDVGEGNRSLDTVTTSLLRRVNRVLLGRPLRVDQRDTLLKGVFADQVLAPLTSPAAAIHVPEGIAQQVRQTALEWRDLLTAGHYTVVGDLDDLIPPPRPEQESSPAPEPLPDPDRVAASAELRVAARAVARLLHDLGSMTDDVASAKAKLAESELRAAESERRAVELEHRGAGLQARLDEHRDLSPGVRLRRAVIEVGADMPTVRGALGAYRGARSVWRRFRPPGHRGQHASPASPESVE